MRFGEGKMALAPTMRRPEQDFAVDLRLLRDTVASWHHKRHALRGLPQGETGAVTAIQRANSDLRLSVHFHTLFLDGLCGAPHSPFQDMPEVLPDVPGHAKRGPQGWAGGYGGLVPRCDAEVLERRNPLRIA